jgi:O-antigen ligase
VTPPRPPATSGVASIADSLASVAAFALLFAVPLVWDIRALDAFRDPQSEVALATLSALAGCLLVRADGVDWWDGWWLAWAGVLAGGLLAALFAGPRALRAAGGLFPVVLAALAWGTLRTFGEERRRRLLTWVVAAGVVESALALLFVNPDWEPASFHALGGPQGRYAWIGTLGNPGYLGTFLVLPAVVAASQAARSHKHRAVWASAALLLTVGVVGSRTLTAVGALIAGGAVLIWRALESRRRWIALAALATSVALVVAATPLRSRVVDAIRTARVGGLTWMGSARGAAFETALAMVAAHPFTGVGIGMFAADSFLYQSEATLASRGRVLGLETGFGEAHNDVLQYAAETGLLGVLLAAAGIVLAVRRSRAQAETLDTPPLLAAAAVLGLSQFPLHLASVSCQWLVLFALAVPPSPIHETLAGAGAWLRAAMLVLATAGGGVVAWQRWSASVDMQRGRLLAEALPLKKDLRERRALARTALEHLAGRERWLPASWDARLVLGTLALDAGDTSASLAYFRAALGLADRPEIRFDVGMALLASGDREGGMAQLERAVRLNPQVFRRIADPGLAQSLRRRLDASGYGTRHSWMYEGTPAATP